MRKQPLPESGDWEDPATVQKGPAAGSPILVNNSPFVNRRKSRHRDTNIKRCNYLELMRTRGRAWNA